VKRYIFFISACLIFVANTSCTKPDYKKAANDFIASKSPAKNYTIREVDNTESPDWKAVVVYVKQNMMSMPVILFVSADGKSVVLNSMVYVNNKPIFTKRFDPELGRIDFKLTDKDRFVYNPAGKKTVYMFTDPDCPYCKKAKETLINYSGEYRVIVKYFPLEQIHPGSTQKAIAEQAEWLKKSRKDIATDADRLREAERIVKEDIAEAQKADIQGVPIYVMEDGSLKQGLF
jgi:protein-disulfide isomerase